MQIKPSAVSLLTQAARLSAQVQLCRGIDLGLRMMWTEGPGVVTAGRTCKGADQLEP